MDIHGTVNPSVLPFLLISNISILSSFHMLKKTSTSCFPLIADLLLCFPQSSYKRMSCLHVETRVRICCLHLHVFFLPTFTRFSFTLSPHWNPSCQSWWWSISSPPLSSVKHSALGTTSSSEAPTSWTSRTPHFPGPSPPGVVSTVSLFDCLSFLYPTLDHWPSSLPTLHSYWMASSIPWFQVDHLWANDSQIYAFILNLSWTPGSCLNASCIWPVAVP